MRKHTSRVAAALGVFALSAAAVVGGSTVAYADPAGYGNIDFTKTGSLTVHKYLHQTATPGTVGDISEAPAPGDYTDPVGGVVFTVYPLLKDGAALDLTVPATWDGLNAIAPGAACAAPAGYTLGAGVPMPATNPAAGDATLALPIGVYQVCETFAPSNIIDRAKPFILAVPMPHENGWVYDVHAFPKNGEGEIVKSVDPQGTDTGLGATISYPVTAAIPATDGPWTLFGISDTFDSRLEPVGTGVASVAVDGAPLDPAYYSVSPVVANKVTVSFTAAGLTWLNSPLNAHAGSQIQVTFEAKVIAIGDGVIQNRAFLNTPGSDLGSDPVTVTWGSVELQKRAAGTTGTTGRLQGAVFEVYNATAATRYAADCTDAVADTAAGRITVGTANTFTSNATGVVAIPGLFVSDSVNPAVNADQRCYVVKEIAAPAGYVLPADPFTAITVVAGETVLADALNLDIANNQQPPVALPLTGANGQLVLLYAGGAAAAIAIGLVLVNRRRARVTK